MKIWFLSFSCRFSCLLPLTLAHADAKISTEEWQKPKIFAEYISVFHTDFSSLTSVEFRRILPTAIDKTDRLEIDFQADSAKLISDKEMLIVGSGRLAIIPLSSETQQNFAVDTSVSSLGFSISRGSFCGALATRTTPTSRALVVARNTSQTAVQQKKNANATVQASWQRNVPGILDACVSDDGKFYILFLLGENLLFAVFSTRQTEKYRIIKVLDYQVTRMTASGEGLLLYSQLYASVPRVFYFNSKKEIFRTVDTVNALHKEFHAAGNKQFVFISQSRSIERWSEECQKNIFTLLPQFFSSSDESFYGVDRHTGWIFCIDYVRNTSYNRTTKAYFLTPEGQWVFIVHQWRGHTWNRVCN